MTEEDLSIDVEEDSEEAEFIRSHLNDYKLVRKLGQGKYGTVFLAHALNLGKIKVAIKVIPASILLNPHECAQLAREVVAGFRLKHLHVAALYDCIYDKCLAFVMEFVDGPSLRELLNNTVPSYQKALLILLQIAEGLAEMHRHGLIHRDLKPANILVTKDGIAKIVDLGMVCPSPAERKMGAAFLSIKLDSSQDEILTNVSGTPLYMAPEYLKFGELTKGVDIYAFGMIALEVLGYSVGCELPLDLESALDDAISTDPALRPQSMEPLVELLRTEFRRQHSVRSTVPDWSAAPKSKRHPLRNRRSKHRNNRGLSKEGRSDKSVNPSRPRFISKASRQWLFQLSIAIILLLGLLEIMRRIAGRD